MDFVEHLRAYLGAIAGSAFIPVRVLNAEDQRRARACLAGVGDEAGGAGNPEADGWLVTDAATHFTARLLPLAEASLWPSLGDAERWTLVDAALRIRWRSSRATSSLT